jgi:uncharacterized protein (DUF1800 family)
MITHQKKIQHLLLRAGFGATPALVKRFEGNPIEQVVDALFDDATIMQELLYLKKPPTNSKGEIRPLKSVSLFLKSQKEKEELNLAWIDRMSVARAQLREKMTFFWHNHFATSAVFAWLMQVQHNTLRTHALGSFREMLHAISKDPAMILWLNNQENKKDAPNENFAREVMELFTLGEGNGYSENDIKQAARAFTGWSVNRKGEYEFRPNQHDDGEKIVFGNKGNFNGNDIIDMLLEKPQTSEYICRKIYRNFVNAETDEDRVKELALKFRTSGYDIAGLMKTIFRAEWFYSEENIGCLIVSPVELIVRLKKLCRLEVDDRQMLALQDVLGQTLFLPPNVAGWKGGRAWIHSTTLVQRLHLSKAMIDSGTARLNKRPAFEAEDNNKNKKDKERVKVKSDWSALAGHFKNTPDNKLTEEIIAFLVQSPDDRIDRKLIEQQVDPSTKQRRIITTIAAVMQTPEFQII